MTLPRGGLKNAQGRVAGAPGRPARTGRLDARRSYLRGYAYLVGSNAGAKAVGLVREMLVAALFGASPALGLYVLLRSGVETLSVTATGAFQLSAVPRLARLAAGPAGIDERRLFADAIRLGLLATLVSALGMSVAIVLLTQRFALDTTALVAVLSMSVGVLIVGVAGLTRDQATGQFGRMSSVFLLTAVLMAALVYPLGRWLGVVGLALTWLVSVTVQAVVVWRPALRRRDAVQTGDDAAGPLLGWPDLRPGVLVAGNQMVLCLIGMKLLAALGGLASVAVVNYALVLAGLFVTTIARTMSSVMLKAAADGLPWRGLRLAVAVQLLASAGLYIALVLWGEAGVRVIFERGSFDAESTEAVLQFLLRAFPGLTLLGILDLVIVYTNGRGLAAAPRMFARIGGLLLGSLAAACIFAVMASDPAGAPIAFVSAFAVTALGAALLAIWQEGRAS